jgi:hypothetical protein
MRSTRASLALAQIAFVAAIGVSARAVYVFAHGVCVLGRSQEGSPMQMCSPFHGTLFAVTSQGSATSARPLDEQ